MWIRFGVERPDGVEPVEVRGCHIMTPETGHSTHYFFYGSRNFLVDDAQFSSISRIHDRPQRRATPSPPPKGAGKLGAARAFP